MAANVRQSNQPTQQQIYEQFMNYASFRISSYDTFNITQLSELMQELYVMQVERQQKKREKNYYKLRNIGISTYISDFEYPNLSDIFINSLDSILESNPNNSSFITNCKKNNAKCTNQESNISKLNFNNIKGIKNFNITKKYNITNRKSRSERCKSCFKFSPNVAGIKLTNTMRNKTLYKNTVSLNLIAHPLKLIPIYITNPLDGAKIETSYINVSVREDVKEIYKLNDGKIHSLVLYHTEYDNINIIMSIVSTIWLIISDTRYDLTDRIKLCYCLHWLLAIACPFFRGSAGFAKVILNAALYKLGIKPVREKEIYFTKSDWIAIFSPTLDIYLSKIHSIFEEDTNAFNQMEEFKKQALQQALQQASYNKYKNGNY